MGRNAAQAQQPNIISLQHSKGRSPVAGERPRCSNPTCDNFAITTATGRISKYCANPQCAKSAWYYRNISAEVRTKKDEEVQKERSRADYAQGYAAATVDQFHAQQSPDPSPLIAALGNIAEVLKAIPLAQLPLPLGGPLSENGQSDGDDALQPLTPLKPAGKGSARKKAAPPTKPEDIELEVKKTTKSVNAGRILILQVWLTSSDKNIELFKPEDLEMVTGHPAFNQTLIKNEIKRRAKLAKNAGAQQATPVPAEKGQGGEVAPGELRKIAGADKPLAEPNYDDLEDLL